MVENFILIKEQTSPQNELCQACVEQMLNMSPAVLIQEANVGFESSFSLQTIGNNFLKKKKEGAQKKKVEIMQYV